MERSGQTTKNSAGKANFTRRARIHDDRCHAANVLPLPSRCEVCSAVRGLHRAARLCAPATGALRLRRGQADLRQLRGALLQGEYARAHPAGDALGGPAHAKAPSSARHAAHDRRPPAGVSPASATIAQLQGIAAREAAGRRADTGNRDQNESGAARAYRRASAYSQC